MISKNEWDTIWENELDGYLDTNPRTGIFCISKIPDFNTSLEVACGSGRDSYYLFQKGKKAIASDYAEGLIESLRKRFPDEFTAQQEDAFSLSFDDKSVDLIFSNGFFVLYQDDKITQLVAERARVAKKYMLFVEHNKLNSQLVEKFRVGKEDNKIYDIRFFEPLELKKLIVSTLDEKKINYKKIRVEKFGGPADLLYGISNKLPLPIKKAALNLCALLIPRIYSLQRWRSTERVAVIVEF